MAKTFVVLVTVFSSAFARLVENPLIFNLMQLLLNIFFYFILTFEVYDLSSFFSSFLEVDYPNVNVSAERNGDAIFEVIFT